MAKKIKVIVAQGIKVGGKYPEIDSEIDLDEAEAKRLLAIGAVELPKAKVEVETGSLPGQKGTGGGKGAEGKGTGGGKGAEGKGTGGGKNQADKSASGQSDGDAELLEKVNAAQTLDELKALLPDEQPSEAVAEAIQKRWTELEATV